MLRLKLRAIKGAVSKGLASLGVALLAGFFSVAAQAFPSLNLVPGTPDIFSAFINTSYVGNNAAGTLTATGQSFTLTPPGAPMGTITGGTFDINSNLSFNTQTASGVLSIGGQIAGLGFNSGTLLTGTLNTFGAGAGDPLEFLFNVTGGDAAVLYGGIGSQAAVILSGTGYSGSFASAFSGSQGLADTAAQGVPVPGTLLLMLSGCGLLALRRCQTRSAISRTGPISGAPIRMKRKEAPPSEASKTSSSSCLGVICRDAAALSSSESGRRRSSS